ncbi:2-methylisocitrate lyase-like PEP mutase family enzyme [Stella humosa]|uniref:2-methylisocitrate lyase-like PEP mutase family enzyme n=1 Tax=Stella humosa TaxID=94 RepID=A0A3N1L2H0_9PROT|nr:isocitrate lyase/phosphoenolpyruvate mutase family protein [Stella humosa]ROP83655.1 2-methylisocitrate lyase-like PEP mutase family enzyme [Stella humosa]BBK33072.1 2-methylisocitrate lyase [Stella humosa]
MQDRGSGRRARVERFQALHARAGAFVIPNPWDAGSARILTALGFEALATTSAGLAFALGRRDGEGGISRDEVLENARAIVDATPLPVSADLEGGFGPSPADCATTIRLAAGVGLVGGSIEDTTADPGQPIVAFGLAVERVRAAVEAARALPEPFVVTARAENFLHARPDLADTIARLQAFEAAGADVLYAPGLPDLSAIRTVCAAVGRPVNVVMGLSGPRYSVAELAGAGVKRISVGGALARAALGAMVRAAEEMRDAGTFDWAADAMPFAAVTRLMAPRA